MKTNVNYYVGLNGSLHYHLNPKGNYVFLPIHRFTGAGKRSVTTEVMRIFLEKNIKPVVLNGFDRCFEYFKYVSFNGESTIALNFEKAFTDFKDDILPMEGRKWSQIKTGSQKDTYNGFEGDCIDVAIKYFCDSDNRRANFPFHDKTLLYEHTEGNWDLYGAEFGEGVPVTLDKPFYARNPYRDIKKNIVIGIDFGLWRGASEEEKEDNKSYVIEHFDGNGLKYLGGENLLEYLSFKVFSEKQNQDKLREKKIWFTFPRCEQEKFPGYETVIKNDSRWANLNMYKMKEALRPVWERHEKYEEKYPENTIDCVLFNNDGVEHSDIRLNVDLELLDREIKEKVREGVKSFMTQMDNAMRDRSPRAKKINIFLAGNSCKAAIVKNIFEEECEIYVKEYKQILLERGEDLEDNLFTIYPPLGTEESDKMREKQGLEVNKNDKSRPTGKTGVAIGLILSRPGSPILVKNENVNLHGEKSFSYLVGKNLREKFKPVLDFESKINGWVKFKSANETTVEFYFTDDSNGRTGDLPIEKTKRHICNLLEVKRNAFIFIRPVSPLEIEYKVSATEKSKLICKIEKISLKEGK
jgi:hypothetical protein